MSDHGLEYNLDSFDVGDFDFDAGIIIDPETDDIFPHIPLDINGLGFSIPYNRMADVSVPYIDETENIPLFDELMPHSKVPRIEESDSSDDEITSNGHQISISSPTVVRNDLRRNFSKMLMNTLNSAQFDQIQEFAQTFMGPSCPFFSYHSALRPEVQVPDFLDCVGPRMFSHYMLGCFVMHPDMYIALGETQVITSTGYPGCRIVMQVEYTLTKTHEIPLQAWIPPPQHVDGMYQQRSLEDMMATLSLHKQKSEASALEDKKTPKKRKRRTKTPQTPLCDSTQRIPESFIDSLHTGAQLIPTVPKALKLTGQMLLTLDEAHRIQHMTLQLHGIAPAV